MGHLAQKWHSAFIKEFSKESDRAAVILTAALFDNALDNMLRSYLVASATGEDELFDGPNAPMGTLSAKITLSYRVGLISASFARDLHLVRKIRNDFAHDITECDFNSPRVTQRVQQLCASSHMTEKDPEHRKKFPDGIKGDFLMVTSWMLWLIHSRSEEMVSINAAPQEFHYSEIVSESDPRVTNSKKGESGEEPAPKSK